MLAQRSSTLIRAPVGRVIRSQYSRSLPLSISQSETPPSHLLGLACELQIGPLSGWRPVEPTGPPGHRAHRGAPSRTEPLADSPVMGSSQMLRRAVGRLHRSRSPPCHATTARSELWRGRRAGITVRRGGTPAIGMEDCMSRSSNSDSPYPQDVATKLLPEDACLSQLKYLQRRR
jgi:hypothetical protein